MAKKKHHRKHRKAHHSLKSKLAEAKKLIAQVAKHC